MKSNSMNAGLMEFTIIGGSLTIGKSEFAMELLRRDSVLRLLLGYPLGGSVALSESAVEKHEGNVTIRFDRLPINKLDEDPRDLLEKLKKQCKDKVYGKVQVKAEYTTFQQVYSYELELGDSSSILPK